MTDHLLFNGIIIDLIVFEKKLRQFNFIDNKIINNLKNLKYKQKIKTMFNIDYNQAKPLLLIFNQDSQILKNIYRYLHIQWMNKSKLLEENSTIHFKHTLSYFSKNKKQITTEIILNEIEYFINQDKIKKPNLINFIINSIIKYYKQI